MTPSVRSSRRLVISSDGRLPLAASRPTARRAVTKSPRADGDPAAMSSSLGQRIRQVLAMDPSADAIEYAERWYTWGDLSRVADGVDRCAAAQQLGAAAPVGVLMQNRAEVVASILGIVMSGRCVVTLSPHQGASRLAADLKALRLPQVIATSEDWDESLSTACVAAGSQGVEVADSGARLRDGADRPRPTEGFRGPMPRRSNGIPRRTSEAFE